MSIKEQKNTDRQTDRQTERENNDHDTASLCKDKASKQSGFSLHPSVPDDIQARTNLNGTR